MLNVRPEVTEVEFKGQQEAGKEITPVKARRQARCATFSKKLGSFSKGSWPIAIPILFPLSVKCSDSETDIHDF